MARIEEAIYSILTASTNVASLVVTRIYPSYLPQDCTMPAVVYERSATERISTFMADPDMSESTIEVMAFASSVSNVNTLADYIRKAITRYKGTVGGIAIDDAWPINEYGTYNDDVGEFQYNITFSIIHAEDAAS